MKSIALTLTVAASLAFAASSVKAQEALAKSSGCLNCHAVDTKKMAPSFKEIATKHKGKADAEGKLVAKLSAGKEHPAVKASPADLSGIIKWVLSLS